MLKSAVFFLNCLYYLVFTFSFSLNNSNKTFIYTLRASVKIVKIIRKYFKAIEATKLYFPFIKVFMSMVIIIPHPHLIKAFPAIVKTILFTKK